jgi:hypothetical protein
MREKARQALSSRVYRVATLGQARNLLEQRAGVVELSWCGDADCGHPLEESVHASLLGTPADRDEEIAGVCTICGKHASAIVRVAIAY